MLNIPVAVLHGILESVVYFFQIQQDNNYMFEFAKILWFFFSLF